MEFTSFGKDQSNTASLERRNDFAKNRHSGDKEGRDRRREHARQRQSQHRSERVNEKRAHLSNDDTSSVELDVEYWLNLLTTMHQVSSQHCSCFRLISHLFPYCRQEKLSAEQLMTMGSFISRNPSSISWFLQQNSLPILQTAFLSFDTNLQFAAAS